MNDLTELLFATQCLLDSPARWCPVGAETADGTIVPADHPRATKWSLHAALDLLATNRDTHTRAVRLCTPPPDTFKQARQLLVTAQNTAAMNFRMVED